MVAISDLVRMFAETFENDPEKDDDIVEDSDSEDTDDEGRTNASNVQNLTALLHHLAQLDRERALIVEATHCVNSWDLPYTGVQAYHHGLILKLSDGGYLRLHLLREGIAWRSYDEAPSLPNSLVSSVKHKVHARPAALIDYCRNNAYWFWPTHDCRVFVNGALETIGVKEQGVGDAVLELLGQFNLASPDQPVQSSSQPTPAGIQKQPQPMANLRQQSPTQPMYTQGQHMSRPVATPQQNMSRPVATPQQNPGIDQRSQAAQRVNAFLHANGFSKGAKKGRRQNMMKDYPLHEAVKQNDAEMVALLLHFGADPRKKNTWGRTPLQQAQRLDNGRSHTRVLSALKAVSL